MAVAPDVGIIEKEEKVAISRISEYQANPFVRLYAIPSSRYFSRSNSGPLLSVVTRENHTRPRNFCSVLAHLHVIRVNLLQCVPSRMQGSGSLNMRSPRNVQIRQAVSMAPLKCWHKWYVFPSLRKVYSICGWKFCIYNARH